MDPKDMTDEQLNKVIETGIAPEEPESTVVAPAAPPEENPEEPEAEEPAEVEAKEEGEEEAPAPSRRETLRVQQLLQKYGQPPERPAPSQNKQEALDYSTALDADPEVIKQLETDRQAYSDAAYLQGIRQSEVKEWRRDLKYEAPIVEKDFPFLNPKDTANFNPAAADAMNQKYLRFIGYQAGDPQRGVAESILYPDVSYREFVEGEVEFADELASRKVAQSTKNIAKQAATTGLRPDGSSAKRLNLNQAPENMSIEELYASIGQKVPTK